MTSMKTTRGADAERATVMLGFSNNTEVTVDSLADLRELGRQIESAMWHQAEVLRNGGSSHGEIAAALGITKQAVQKRLARS